ncbi:MAG: hypothetical protein KAY59_05115, partial [Acidobacteria bacterium]|nr:hypothetical protein [Acidobacteriota bacterium]
DYGVSTYLRMDNRTGQVRYGVIGMQRDTIRWISVPVVDDIADLVIRRLPLERIEDREHELGEIEEDHHIALLLWMKHLAYLKQDADATDKNKSMECRALFEGYCSIAKAEAERYKHKHRAVAYGGL